MNEARTRVVQTLLEQHLGESPARMEERYARALAALHTDECTVAHAAKGHRAIRWARAALIVVTAGALFFLLPLETRAASVLAHTVRNESRTQTSAAERRYEVEVLMPPRLGEARPSAEVWLRGQWDMRGNESRLEIAVEGRPSVIRADAVGGAWERDVVGTVRPLESRALWPRWIEDRDGSVAIERMDGLLRLVQRSYAVAFARAGAESRTELRGALHLVASRRKRAQGPDEIDLWIDTTREVVLEARLRWTAPPRRGAPPPFPPPPPNHEEYRPSRGALPPFPPSELRLRRVEPVSFPADHFSMPLREPRNTQRPSR